MQRTLIFQGYKVRTQSQRRYVVLQAHPVFAPKVIKRSDNVDTAKRYAACHHSTAVFDTTTGQEV